MTASRATIEEDMQLLTGLICGYDDEEKEQLCRRRKSSSSSSSIRKEEYDDINDMMGLIVWRLEMISERDASHHLQIYRALQRYLQRHPPPAPSTTTSRFNIDIISQLFIHGITHAWSAIRASTAALVGQLSAIMGRDQIQILYDQFLHICQHSGIWQHRHGAISAIYAIVRSMQQQQPPPPEPEPAAAAAAAAGAGGGTGPGPGPGLADFLDRDLLDIVFRLLSDDQLSIRHVAVKTWAAYLARTGPAGARRHHCRASLDRALALLAHPEQCSIYYIEGLLELIQEIVSDLSYGELMMLWPRYHIILEMYLGHEACTIRQISSRIYLSLISGHRSDHDPYYQSVFLSYIVQSLTWCWRDVAGRTGPAAATGSAERETGPAADPYQGIYTSSSHIPPDLGHDPNNDDSITIRSWHLAEGILMAQELIIKYLQSRLSRRSRHDHHRPSLSPYMGQISPESTQYCRHEMRLRSQSVSESSSSRSDSSCRLIAILLSLEMDKNMLWTDQSYDHIAQRQCPQCQQSVFYIDRDITRLSTIMSCWLSQAIQCGLSRQWELRRMSDQVLQSLFTFLDSTWASTLVEYIRGPHPSNIERIRACLSGRYLAAAARSHAARAQQQQQQQQRQQVVLGPGPGPGPPPYPPPDPALFLTFSSVSSSSSSPSIDRVSVLSLAVLWDLIVNDQVALERHFPVVLARTRLVAEIASSAARDWFANSIQDSIIELAQSCRISHGDEFISVLLALLRSVSATYRSGLMQALSRMDLTNIRTSLCGDIATLCISVLSDSGSDNQGYLAVNTLETIISTHHNAGLYDEILIALSHRHGGHLLPSESQGDNELLVTPSCGHIKQLSLDSDSAFSSSSSNNACSIDIPMSSKQQHDEQQDQHEFDSDISESDQDLDLDYRICMLMQRLSSSRIGQLQLETDRLSLSSSSSSTAITNASTATTTASIASTTDTAVC